MAALLRLSACLLPLLAAGCATVTVSGEQPIQVLAFDAQDRPVTGLECRLSNLMGEWRARTPATEIAVRRSHSDLEIECRRGKDVAMGTLSPRRDRVEQAMLPFGSVGVAIDHLTGHLYSYPNVVRLRLGQHLRFEFSTEARAAGLVATVGEGTVADIGAGAAPRQPLPAAATHASETAAAAVRPARPARAVPTSPARKPPTTSAPAAVAAPRPSAPLTW